jgi:hypothetical protein
MLDIKEYAATALAKVKTAARWIYDWITVLTASLIGLPEMLLQLLSTFDGINIAPLIGADRALKIVTTVAVVKAVLAFVESQVKAARAK